MKPEPLRLDRFQEEAIAALDDGASVLVAAPTGAGKTLVAEHAIEIALREQRKAFYTTPIKALSNQKYGDLVGQHGVESVGLLTGDNAIRGDAPVVVMTTEVLRNMIYSESSLLSGLLYVVLDEVHYLQDAYRGPVWEEVIVHCPASVKLVCLSATVSNATELADWLGEVRGETATILETQRPVGLTSLYLVGDRSRPGYHLLPILVDGRPNPEGHRFDSRNRGHSPGRGRPRPRFFSPRRVATVERLAEEAMLPVIYFIFSRAACDEAMRRCVEEGLRLTDSDERLRIREILTERTDGLSDSDLDFLDFDRWAVGMETGVAAHHAGMVPAFKEAVEQCFAEGLVKVVFATETLALGINMPARAVVIERLTKFTGETHEFLTPGQYTQLTGRAGRRGIDSHGYAVVLWSPFVDFGRLASLVASRSFPLSSAFRPNYNMAANLVRRYESDEAHHLLNQSFAQFQADRSVVRLERRVESLKREISLLEEQLGRTPGIRHYRELVDELERERVRRPSSRASIEQAVSALKPGDVIGITGEPAVERAVVLSVAYRRRGSIKVRCVNGEAQVILYDLADFQAPPEVLAHVDLPVPFLPHDAAYQHQAAEVLRRAHVRPRRTAPESGHYEQALAAVQSHPVHRLPGRDRLLAAFEDLESKRGQLDDLERVIGGRTDSLARRFDRVLDLLDDWGYVQGWSLTPRGTDLARIYHEADLVVVEALARGVLDDLEPPELAAIVSGLTYEHRSPVPSADWHPEHSLAKRASELESIASDLNRAEKARSLSETRLPEWGFAAQARAWAAGRDLDVIQEGDDISGGDFVRNVKQLIDLLRQIAECARSRSTAGAAARAAEALFRGVVAASAEPRPEPAGQR